MDLQDFYDFSLENPRARRQIVGIQCYFLSGERTFEQARARVDDAFALVAPVGRYAEFEQACARKLGRPSMDGPRLNAGALIPGLGDTRDLLAGRAERDFGEDLRLYQHVRDTFDARCAQLDGDAGPESLKRPSISPRA